MKKEEEMRDLYEKNANFKSYVDGYSVKHGISIEVAFSHEMVGRLYQYYCKFSGV